MNPTIWILIGVVAIVGIAFLYRAARRRQPARRKDGASDGPIVLSSDTSAKHSTNAGEMASDGGLSGGGDGGGGGGD
jgi:hypothetical protein